MTTTEPAKTPKPGTFQKGHDARRNTKGRPKSFNALRELAQQIAHEDVLRGDEPMVINGKKVSVTEAILRAWAASKNPKLQQAFMDVAYGKVPAAVELSGKDGGPLVIQMTWGDDVGDDDAADGAA